MTFIKVSVPMMVNAFKRAGMHPFGKHTDVADLQRKATQFQNVVAMATPAKRKEQFANEVRGWKREFAK